MVLWVGLGGFVGSSLRFLLTAWTQRLFPLSVFPYGTLVVNSLGCLAIGLLGGLGEARQLFGPQTRAFVLIGILGGFTTFSTFAYETLALARDGHLARSLVNALAHVAIGFLAVAAGYAAGRLN